MQLRSQAVKHAAFGKGIITEVSGNTITVCFAQGEKKFPCPDAFIHHLTLKDAALQAELSAMAASNERRRQEEKKREIEKHERQIRLRTMKIPPKSQAAFDATPEQLVHYREEGALFTGRVLSGPSQGKPRVPKAMKPNTACLLTARPAGGDEEQRQILGAFMVRDDFWGDACSDGLVRAHDRYRLMLPAPMPFWAFLDGEKQRSAWGSVPFRVFSNQTMRTILREMLGRLEGTPQAGEASAFYAYFCDMNQMMP